MSISHPTKANAATMLAIRVLALIATVVAGYLFWITLTHGTVAGCGDESGHVPCGHVLRSPWSRWLGMPVSLFGCLVYFVIFITSFLGDPSPTLNKARTAANSVLLVSLVLAAGSAVWFLVLQLFVIRKICPFCMLVHVIGLAITFLMIGLHVPEVLRRRKERDVALLQQVTIGHAARNSSYENGPDANTPGIRWQAAIALIGLSLLIVGQLVFPSKTFDVRTADELEGPLMALDPIGEFASIDDTTNSIAGAETASQPTKLNDVDQAPSNTDHVVTALKPESPVPAATPPKRQAPESAPLPIEKRLVSLLSGKLRIDIYQHGLLGSPKAKHVAVELVDYTCKDCRTLHQLLKVARARQGDNLAIVVLPIPLDSKCNPYIEHTTHHHNDACKYARLALAVSLLDRNAFEEFHEWLMDSISPPPLEDAVAKASQLVGRDRLSVEIKSKRLARKLRAPMGLLKRIRRLPTMIVGDEFVVGLPKDANEFVETLEQRLGSTASDM